jgi:hypothetical protein
MGNRDLMPRNGGADLTASGIEHESTLDLSGV